MNLKIGICDDREEDVQCLAAAVQGWAKQENVALHLDTFPSAESLLFAYATQKDYDIFLLDIEMKTMNGVQLAKKIREENDAVQIIFVTGFTDYIAEGYDVCALHYLIKPIGADKLFEVLQRAATKIKKNEKSLFLTQSGETIRVPIYTIRYIEVRQNYVTIHAKNDYTIKKTLGECEQELDEHFFRIGRSFLVNLSCIDKITKTSVFLSDGSILPLPRGQYEPLNQAFIAYT